MKTKVIEDMKKEKNIEIILHEMIDECLRLGYKPRKIRITKDRYKELQTKIGGILEKGLVKTPTEIVFRENDEYLDITHYKGIPIYIDKETKLLWL